MVFVLLDLLCLASITVLASQAASYWFIFMDVEH